MPLDEDADPFTDPDAPSHLLAQTHRLPPPLPLSLATDKGKGKEHDMATSTPILRKPWSARAKVEGWYAAGARSHAALGGAPSKGKAGGVASQSYTGGVNQSFLHLINALAVEEPDSSADTSGADDSSADEASVISSSRPTTHHHTRRPLPRLSASSHLPPISASNVSSPNDSDAGDDDPPPSFLSPLPSRSKPVVEEEQDEGVGGADGMSSSLYAIHRPIAARRRTATGEEGESSKAGEYVQQAGVEEDPEMTTVEEEKGAPGDAGVGAVGVGVTRKRSGTSSTARTIERRARLADKLADIFGLDKDTEEVIAEFQCWLFRSVLLQGFVYLTSGHICFYAYLPHKEGVVIRSEGLSVRGARTRRYYRHWFILKDALLTWYPSSNDPYFPDGHVDLHYCISVEPSLNHPTHFKVLTAEKKWHFSADSQVSRDEWVKTLKRVVFRCQNEGESVKIAIPLETVVDIERSSNLEFTETIRIRVYDADEGFTIDEYWLSYFVDIDLALVQLTAVLTHYRDLHPDQAKTAASIVDTTQKGAQLIRAKSYSRAATMRPSATSNWTSLNSRLRLFSADRSSQSLATLTSGDSKSGATTPTRSFSPRPSMDSQVVRGDTMSDSDIFFAAPLAEPSLSMDQPHEHTYPPEPSAGDPPPDLNVDPKTAAAASGWAIPSLLPSLPAVPEWLKGTRKGLFTAPAAAVTAPVRKAGRKIVEVVTLASETAPPLEQVEKRDDPSATSLPEDLGGCSFLSGHNSTTGSVVGEEGDEDELEEKANAKLRMSFGLTEKEQVIAQFTAYLFRGLPIYGRIYVSTTFLCFRSLGIAGTLSKTKMILPLSDIIAVSKHRSYRIGYSGMIVVIKGHEELFFELNSADRRDSCIEKLDLQSELVHQQLADGATPGDTAEHKEHLDLLDLAASGVSETDTGSRPHPENVAGQPPVMFCSTSSDFVTFRPEKSLRFTCLTIGSRGDVQPYIALCKGLMAEGHKCKIASHAEYRSWVEGHGIAFEEVGGDPADLMQLMIAHDFFTISFMKEALGHFRGWLDDLLVTAATACANTDVLIESPSTIAGIHIAEAMQIPYYRAFTMPWSRTRAYPHAFAVPDHKMGGSYNYMTYTMFDQIFWRATSGQINRWRKKTLGLRPTNLELMQQHKIPFLYNFSPVVIPPPLDWRENIHVTGYWWLDNPDDSAGKKWQPPADLLVFLVKAKSLGKKVVFIGFGSIIIPDPEEMTRVVTGAVEKAGVYAIVAKGWSDRALTHDASPEERLEAEQMEAKSAAMLLRPDIYNVKSIPHDWLFPRISAAVHHGGSGTTGASLRAGLPTIIKPYFGDQYFYADRVATLGVGSAVRNLTVGNLAAAIVAGVTDEKQIARAKAAGEAIRKEDGVGTAIECIYRDLEYARSLIPPLPPPPPPKAQVDSAPTPQPSTLTRASSLSRIKGALRSSSTPSSPHRLAGHSGAGSSEERDDWDIMSAGSSTRVDEQKWEDLVDSRGSSITSKSPGRSGARSGPASSRGGGPGTDEDDDDEEADDSPVMVSK